MPAPGESAPAGGFRRRARNIGWGRSVETDMTHEAAVVMVVDNEAPIRSAIAARLDLEGYAVVEAASADEAIDTMQHRAVDAVISDVRMPGQMDGVGLAVWISRNAPSVLVLLMSGRRPPEALRQLLPAIPFFHKPFAMGALLTALNHRIHKTTLH
jgi:DNA-binding NtrC family response regulator